MIDITLVDEEEQVNGLALERMRPQNTVEQGGQTLRVCLKRSECVFNVGLSRKGG